MIENFKSFIRENHLILPGEKILLTVSGGMDSMAMAMLFAEAGYAFSIAHCNFKLRGMDSDEDEAFVSGVAKQLGAHLFTQSFNTAAIAEKENISIQMAARDLRYAYFQEIAGKYGFSKIATAHHLDDQNETFFINLSRGCGIAGLHGIRAITGNIIRPLMFAFRKDIEAYLMEKGIAYREDASNRSTKYSRNLIRHEILPLMIKLNPSFSREMAATIKRLDDTEQIFREYVAVKGAELIQREGDAVLLDIREVLKLTAVDTFLYELISEYGFRKDDVSNILNAIGGEPGKIFNSLTHRLIVDRKKLIVAPLALEDPSPELYEIDKEVCTLASPVRMDIDICEIPGYTIRHAKNIASLDYSLLAFPLQLRRWKAGDSFIPLGMKNHKKLSDFFIDEKYSLLQKENCWLLCSGNDIIWILGERINDRYKVTGDTKLVYQLEII